VWFREIPGAFAAGSGAVTSLELQIFVRRRVEVAGDEAQAWLRHAAAVAVEERGLDERGEHDALVHELLDLRQDCRAPLGIELTGLLLVEAIDVRETAVRSASGRDHERLDARGGVAGRGAADPRELELLLLVALLEARPLQARSFVRMPTACRKLTTASTVGTYTMSLKISPAEDELVRQSVSGDGP
jgi:hypothetical protein